jgi:hypothetical protein
VGAPVGQPSTLRGPPSRSRCRRLRPRASPNCATCHASTRAASVRIGNAPLALITTFNVWFYSQYATRRRGVQRASCVILLASHFKLKLVMVAILCTIAEKRRTFSSGNFRQAADEQTLIFGTWFIPKSLYLADAYCIAFRK